MRDRFCPRDPGSWCTPGSAGPSTRRTAATGLQRLRATCDLVVAEAVAAESPEPADQRGLPLADQRVVSMLEVIGEELDHANGGPTGADLARVYEHLAAVMERLGETDDALLCVRCALTLSECVGADDGDGREQRLRARSKPARPVPRDRRSTVGWCPRNSRPVSPRGPL